MCECKEKGDSTLQCMSVKKGGQGAALHLSERRGCLLCDGAEDGGRWLHCK